MWRGWTADRLVVGRCKTWESAAIMCGQRVACKRPGFCAIDRGKKRHCNFHRQHYAALMQCEGVSGRVSRASRPVNQLVLNAEAKWAQRPRVQPSAGWFPAVWRNPCPKLRQRLLEPRVLAILTGNMPSQ